MIYNPFTRFYFYPRPPRGGRPTTLVESLSRLYISIHALREEGDRASPEPKGGYMNFYPRPPRGGRPGGLLHQPGKVYFYPRPPRGGRQRNAKIFLVFRRISIHALREEGDASGVNWPLVTISFLSTPSARRATTVFVDGLPEKLFLSTPSARRATTGPSTYWM